MAAQDQDQGLSIVSAAPLSDDLKIIQSHIDQQQPVPHDVVSRVLDWLPAVGGAAGGLIGGAGGTVFGMGVGGVPGAIGGAAIGGAGGEAWRQLIERMRGKGGPATAAQAAAPIATQAGIQGAAEAGGQVLSAGAAKVAPMLMQSALKPTQRVLAEYKTTAPKIVQTLLDEGVNVTNNGLAKLQGLFNATNDEIKTVLQARHDLLQQLSPTQLSLFSSSPANPLLPGAERVVDKSQVAARVLPTAYKIAQQTNAATDLRAVGDTVQEFLDHPIFKGNLTLPEAQAMKQGTYQQIGRKYGEAASASIETQKALARGLKEEIASQVPEIAGLNRRDAELMAAMDAVGQRAALSGNKDPVGFAWVTQNPTAFLAAMFDRSAAAKSLLARGLYSQAATIAKVSPQLVRAAVTALSARPDAPDGGPPQQ